MYTLQCRVRLRLRRGKPARGQTRPSRRDPDCARGTLGGRPRPISCHVTGRGRVHGVYRHMCVHDNTTETVGMCRENVDKLMKTKRSRVLRSLSTLCTATAYSTGYTAYSTGHRERRNGKRNVASTADRTGASRCTCLTRPRNSYRLQVQNVETRDSYSSDR